MSRVPAAFVLALGLGGGLALPGGAQEATPAAVWCPATTPEDNVELVTRYIDEVYNAHNPAAAAGFLSDDFNRGNPARPHRNEPGTADDVARVERSLAEFPDLSGTIDDIFAGDDTVVVRLTYRGTHQGAFADLGAAATGRAAEWPAIVIWRVECGKLVESWTIADRLGELRQLGIVTDDELATVGEPTVATPVP